ncbi:hypothetical protein [Listeria sp. PSOL-1]|uniref:hypothetical protein n=1 Tax=Listeria sp. PSOL-1 TaxID=1844999 RepID=UPI0013D68DDF|nr:hypothetical protein [Listeria sp. PSOL-1]
MQRLKDILSSTSAIFLLTMLIISILIIPLFLFSFIFWGMHLLPGVNVETFGIWGYLIQGGLLFLYSIATSFIFEMTTDFEKTRNKWYIAIEFFIYFLFTEATAYIYIAITSYVEANYLNTFVIGVYLFIFNVLLSLTLDKVEEKSSIL